MVQTVTDEVMDMHETDEFLKERLGRKLVVIGASTGTDAHTVGIDAIMNRRKWLFYLPRRRTSSLAVKVATSSA